GQIARRRAQLNDASILGGDDSIAKCYARPAQLNRYASRHFSGSGRPAASNDTQDWPQIDVLDQERRGNGFRRSIQIKCKRVGHQPTTGPAQLKTVDRELTDVARHGVDDNIAEILVPDSRFGNANLSRGKICSAGLATIGKIDIGRPVNINKSRLG